MIATRTQVKCTEHDGQHTGIVVAHLGGAYGVAWHGAPRVTAKTEAERELARAHAKHFLSTPADAIVVVPLVERYQDTGELGQA